MTATSTVLPTGQPPPRRRPSSASRPMIVAFSVVTLLVVSGAYLLLTRDDTTVAPPAARTLTHTQLVRSAEAICTTLNTEAAKAGAPAGAAPAQMAAFLDGQLTITRRAAVALRALTPPPADRASWTSALTGIDGALVDLRSAAAALHKGDAPTGRRLLAKVERDTTTVNAAFTRLGMPTCAS